MKLLLAVILVSLCVLSVDSALLEGFLQKETYIYGAKIRLVYDLLVEECPTFLMPRREISTQNQPLHLQVQKQLYDQLLTKLNQCRKLKSLAIDKPPTTTASTTTTSTTATTSTTSTVKPTTPQPIECQQATNYMQSWRRDHNGSDIKPGGPNSYNGYACDFHVTNSEWFRFTGEAGNRMLDKCPKVFSCGAVHPYWTDAEMPKVVGVESTVVVYGVWESRCKVYKKQVKVMRCSSDTEHDFIYKQTTDYSRNCSEAFCGMF